MYLFQTCKDKWTSDMEEVDGLMSYIKCSQNLVGFILILTNPIALAASLLNMFLDNEMGDREKTRGCRGNVLFPHIGWKSFSKLSFG